MSTRKHVALLVVLASLGAADVGANASASTGKWSKSQCESWIKSFRKQHPQRTSAHKTEAIRTLKTHDCALHRKGST